MKKSYLVVGMMLLIIAFCIVGPVSAQTEEHSGRFNATVYTKEGIPVRVDYFIGWQYDSQPANCSHFEGTVTGFMRMFASEGVMRDEFASLTIKEILQSKGIILKVGATAVNKTNEVVGFPECNPKVNQFVITSINVPQLQPPGKPHCPDYDCSASDAAAKEIITTVIFIFFVIIVIITVGMWAYYRSREKGETSEKKQ